MQTHKVVCKTMCNLICSIIHSLALQPPAQSLSLPATLVAAAAPCRVTLDPWSLLRRQHTSLCSASQTRGGGQEAAPTGDASQAPGTVLSSSCPSGLPTPSRWDRETERSLQ